MVPSEKTRAEAFATTDYPRWKSTLGPTVGNSSVLQVYHLNFCSSENVCKVVNGGSQVVGAVRK
jgi:hypothetical protein